MISLSPVITLLKAETTTFDKWFRKVGNDVDYAKLDASNVPSPQAWVLPNSRKPTSSGERSDTLDIAFDVVIAVDRRVKRNDDEADEHLNRYCFEVYRRLRGIRLAKGLTPIKYLGGRILRSTDKDILWVESYSFSGQVDAYMDNPPGFESLNNIGATP